MLEQTLSASGTKTPPCASALVRIGGSPPAPASLCFFLNGLLSSVDTPGYEMEFNEFSDFNGKQIAHLYLSQIQPETLLVGKIDKLEHSNKKADFFATPQSQSSPDPLASYTIDASQIEKLAENSTGLNWPTVSSGKTEGSISLFVSVDTHGQVREASVLSTDNPELDQAALDQLLGKKLKPAAWKGSPVQVEGPLLLSFSTKTDSSSKTSSTAVGLPSGVVAGKAISQPRPHYPDSAKQQHISGSVYLRAIIAADGTILKLGVIESASPILSEAALAAVKQWKYQPYLLDGVPTKVSTTITVNFSIGPSTFTLIGSR
ncbi:energy transducer TonB [Edaphobacter bradus]|uniref:energy transducer TonB n=1 Tax=Edaphobacter bradus TaxID=2259016 RepID=UPI0021E06532|nr:energy transducer TonB [Edaphobacter bradus]